MAQVPNDVVKEFEQALDDEADRWLQEAASEIPSVKDEK
jgi:hypothetical protein